MYPWKKLLIPFCLAFLLLMAGAGAAFAENTPLPDYPYTAQAVFDGSTVSGTLTPRDDYQNADQICVHAVFYMSGGYQMQTVLETTALTFQLEAVGAIEYVTLDFKIIDDVNTIAAAPVEIYYNRPAAQQVYTPKLFGGYQDGVVTVGAVFQEGDTRSYQITIDGQETGRALDASASKIGIAMQLQTGQHVVKIYNAYIDFAASFTFSVEPPPTDTPPSPTDFPATPPAADVPSGVTASYQNGVLTVTALGDWSLRYFSIWVDDMLTGKAVSPNNKTQSFSIALADGKHTVVLNNDAIGTNVSATFTVGSPAPTASPWYTMLAVYDGATVSGRLEHDPSTQEANDISVRASFYMENNYYTATMAEVNADGTFSIAASGPIFYITVTAMGSPAANPMDYVKIAEPVQIFVRAQTNFGAPTGDLPQDIAAPSGVSLDFTASYTSGDLALTVAADGVCELFIDGRPTGKAIFSAGEYHFPFTLENGNHTVTLYAPRLDKSVRKTITATNIPDFSLTASDAYLEISPAHEKAVLGVRVVKSAAVDWPEDGISLVAYTTDETLCQVSQVYFTKQISDNEQAFVVKLAPAETGVGVAWVKCSLSIDPRVCFACPVIVHDTAPSVLPASLQTIEAEALSGIAAREIQVPDECAAIGSGAFASCDGLKLVVIGEGLISIASDAFANCPGVQVVCPESVESLILNKTGIQPVIR